jgi:hypothetical protein
MGFKLRGVLRCGACGKPRGLGPHLCSPGKRRQRRTRPQNPVTWECPACHKARGLLHTCSPVRGDFKRRKREAIAAKRAERRRLAAAQRRARDKARKTLGSRKTGPPRQRAEGHEPGTCGDRDCPKYGCKAYFAGMEDCPLPHGG